MNLFNINTIKCSETEKKLGFFKYRINKCMYTTAKKHVQSKSIFPQNPFTHQYL